MEEVTRRNRHASSIAVIESRTRDIPCGRPDPVFLSLPRAARGCCEECHTCRPSFRRSLHATLQRLSLTPDLAMKQIQNLSLKIRKHLRELGTDGRIILKRVLETHGVTVRAGFD